MASESYGPGPGPVISLQEITADTVRAVVALEVHPEQRAHVAPNSVSLAEALFNKGAWFRAVYAGEEPVGFVMLFDPTVEGAEPRGPVRTDQMGLWRLMIDRRHQRRGIGRQALDLVCEHVRRRPGFNELLSSYVPGEHGPEAFYMRYGFRRTGQLRNDNEEIEIVLPLTR
jgi:diamine N-acetyltransferase